MTVSTDTRPPVVILFGGPSAEHDVSIVSGTAIETALRAAGFPTRLLLIDLDGGWWWLPADHVHGDRSSAAYDDPTSMGADGPHRAGPAMDRLIDARPVPVVFIALHGPFGEDGTVQALLEAAGMAYTGSGVMGSAIGMDKVMQKRIWRGLGLPVLDWREIHVAQWKSQPEAVLGELTAFATGAGDQRLMIKPARLGSSVGMTLAHDAGERGMGLDRAFRFDTVAVVEPYLAGARDLEIAIIGTEPPLGVYGPGEVMAGREFYDYAAKYTPGLSSTSLRADVPDPVRLRMHKLARDAYRATGAEGFARVDFLLAGDRLYLSEINTIPGFTPISLFPTLPAEAGISFEAVCQRIIDLALDRHRTRASSRLAPSDLPR